MESVIYNILALLTHALNKMWSKTPLKEQSASQKAWFTLALLFFCAVVVLLFPR